MGKEKFAIETIVNNFKNEVEMNNSIYVSPNEKDIDGFFFEDSTDDVIHNLVVRAKVEEKYNQTFKENYQYVLYLKNTKNVFALNFITKGTKLDKDFISEYEKIDDGKSDWKVLQFILKNSDICFLEVMKKS